MADLAADCVMAILRDSIIRKSILLSLELDSAVRVRWHHHMMMIQKKEIDLC